MNNIKKTACLNLILCLTLIFIALPYSKGLSQSDNDTSEDFSNAQDAEEKRAKWGTEEFKLELIKEMSSANIALFIDEHLSKIKEPSRIYYRFQKIQSFCDFKHQNRVDITVYLDLSDSFVNF